MISTYSELQAAVLSWAHRSDISSDVPNFISLAEAKFNRRLRTRHQEEVLAATTISDNEIALPDDIAAVKSLWVPNYEGTPLKAQSLEAVVALTGQGVPTVYAWQSDSWRFNGSGDVQGVYYVKVPVLSDSSTSNWLLSEAPDLYLWGALAELAFFIKDDNRGALWTARTDALISELNGADKRDSFSGPLVARAR